MGAFSKASIVYCERKRKHVVGREAGGHAGFYMLSNHFLHVLNSNIMNLCTIWLSWIFLKDREI